MLGRVWNAARTATQAKQARVGYTLPTPALLASLDDVTGWVATGGTVTLDTSHQVQGTGCLKLVGDGATNSQYGTKNPYTGTYTPNTFGVLAVCANTAGPSADLTDVDVQMASGANSGQVNFLTAGTRFRLGQRWIAWDVSEMSTFGALSSPISNMVVRLKQTSAGAKAATTYWDALYTTAKGRPTIVFTFDDGYITHYTTVRPLLDRYGWKGTYYACPYYIDRAGGSPGWMTLDQVRDLYAHGWDIGCDSTDDAAFTSKGSPSAAVTDIQTVQAYLVVNGMPFARNHFCWPNGSWCTAAGDDTYAAAMAAAGLLSGRTTETQSCYDRFGLGDIAMTIPSQGASSSTLLSVHTARVDEALLRGTTQFFHFHDVQDTPSAIGWQTSKFAALLDYIYPYWRAGLIDVLTVSQWYSRAAAGHIGA